MLQVQIFLDEEDLHKDGPLYEHILRYLLHHNIMGGTMFKGVMGFGSHHHLHAPRKIAGSDPLPVMIVFVDEEEKVAKVIPHLKEIVSEGLIIAQKVERI